MLYSKPYLTKIPNKYSIYPKVVNFAKTEIFFKIQLHIFTFSKFYY